MRLWGLTGNRIDVTFNFACIHVCNGIPTALLMFSGSGDTTGLLQWLPDVTSYKLLAVTIIFDCSVTLRSDSGHYLWLPTTPHVGSLCISLIALADSENIHFAVGISLPPSLKAERIYANQFCAGRHLRIPTSEFPHLVVQWWYLCCWSARPQKHGYSRWNHVAIW